MSNRYKHIAPDGVARPSQMLHTYAPGALVDLPERSVIIGGLDDWVGGDAIDERRLLAEVRKALPEAEGLTLRSPPVEDDDERTTRWVRAWEFPEWFLAPEEERYRGGVAREMVRRQDRGRWRDRSRRIAPLSHFVPVRFVQACDNGHISDIAWSHFAHRGGANICDRPRLLFVERGTSGDFADLEIACAGCSVSRPLADARPGSGGAGLGPCYGSTPWLGPGVRRDCVGPTGDALRSKLLVRHATNAHFPLILSVIHVPDRHEALERAVGELWEKYLSSASTEQELTMYAKLPEVAAGLSGFDLTEVWAYLERRRKGGQQDRTAPKDAEMRTFAQAAYELGNDVPDGTFYARRFKLDESRRVGPAASLDRVVLVHRLQEVSALVGFTRFAAIETNIGGELDDRVDLQVKLAPLADTLHFVPAVRNNGEGVLLTFQQDAVKKWLARDGVQRRGARLEAAWARNFQSNGVTVPPFPGLPYIMLHTLSHLLLTAVSLECGYSTSAIKERVYAGQHGHGILLFTGAPDAEGTLGGLVQVGREIDRHLRLAVEMGRLCSNDPICAQHDPADHLEARFLHGAACHGCLLVAETCCERRNHLLDRALVVPTLHVADAAFFA